jgi:serine O-acetyltransferase
MMNDKELQEINEVTRYILDDYHSNRVIDRFNLFQQPNRGKVEDIVNKLFRIIYPGYFRDRSYKIYNLENSMAMLIEDVIYHLHQQILIALPYCKEEGLTEEDYALQANQITMQFMRQIPKVRALLEEDIDAFYVGDPAAENKDEIIFSYPGLQAVTVHRLAHELYVLGVPIIPRIMSEYAHSHTGVDIHPGAALGHHFFIDHGTGIVIGETSVIGDNVKIYQGVTLGGLSTRGGQSLRGKRRHPTIEDNVTIYSGASILGGHTVIGHDAVIGGNSFITSSISPYSKVSIKNEELMYNETTESVEEAEKKDENAWFYVI